MLLTTEPSLQPLNVLFALDCLPLVWQSTLTWASGRNFSANTPIQNDHSHLRGSVSLICQYHQGCTFHEAVNEGCLSPEVSELPHNSPITQWLFDLKHWPSSPHLKYLDQEFQGPIMAAQAQFPVLWLSIASHHFKFRGCEPVSILTLYGLHRYPCKTTIG